MPQNPPGVNASVNAAGARRPTGVGAQRDAFYSAVHGSKYNQAFDGALFCGANTAGVTPSAGLATTYVGLCLTNPADSGFNLAVRGVAGGCIAAPAAFAIAGIMVGSGAVTHTTPITPKAAIVGGDVGVGLLDSAATIPTPILRRILASSLGTGANFTFSQDLEGGLILPPGTFAAFYITGGPTSGFLGSIEWEEIPVVA